MTDTDVQALEHERLQRAPQTDRLTELFTQLLSLIWSEYTGAINQNRKYDGKNWVPAR